MFFFQAFVPSEQGTSIEQLHAEAQHPCDGPA
jgi:hypothetical protein